MSEEIAEISKPCPGCGNVVIAHKTGNIKCKACGMKLKVTSDGSIVSNEYEPTMEDVFNHSYGIKTEGSEWWAGHVRKTIGAQCEGEAGLAFSIPLEHIPDTEHNKPDFVNSDSKIVVEVYSGAEIGKIDREMTGKLGMPLIRVKAHDIREHLMEALRHAKDKMNQDTVDYLSEKHEIDGGFTYLAMYVMEAPVYLNLNREMMIDIYSKCRLGDYCIDGIVVYWHPAGLGDEPCGGNVFVFYEDGSKIDRDAFVKSAEFICLDDHHEDEL